MSFGPTRTWCAKCAATFPDLVDGRRIESRLHQEVLERLAKSQLCGLCFESYQKTAALCRRLVAPQTPAELGPRLADFLRRRTQKP